jgi:hypothetical protein
MSHGTVNYGVGGAPGGDNYAFSVPDNATVSFSYDPTTHILTINTGSDSGGGDIEPGDEELVALPLRNVLADEFFYFVLPDRFETATRPTIVATVWMTRWCMASCPPTRVITTAATWRV